MRLRTSMSTAFEKQLGLFVVVVLINSFMVVGLDLLCRRHLRLDLRPCARSSTSRYTRLDCFTIDVPLSNLVFQNQNLVRRLHVVRGAAHCPRVLSAASAAAQAQAAADARRRWAGKVLPGKRTRSINYSQPLQLGLRTITRSSRRVGSESR